MALRISIPMPPRLTHHVLAAALESSCGSGYWLRDYKTRPQWGGHVHVPHTSQDYVALHIGTPAGTSGIRPTAPKHSRIGAARIAAALKLMLTCGNHVHAERAGRVLAESFDAPDADVVLQFAAFGEVIYG